jgi:hypothetical protein
MLAKRGDPAEHLFEQHLRVAFALANLPPKLVRHVREANQHVIASAGEAFFHFAAHGRKFRLHLAADGRQSRPYFAAYVREFNAHFGAELHNLRLYRAYSLSECRDLRGQCLESFHGHVQAFYAIRQQFIRHHSSLPTRRSNSKRAFDGRIKARRVPTTLPSSRRADNCLRARTDGWRHIDAMSTLEVA